MFTFYVTQFCHLHIFVIQATWNNFQKRCTGLFTIELSNTRRGWGYYIMEGYAGETIFKCLCVWRSNEHCQYYVYYMLTYKWTVRMNTRFLTYATDVHKTKKYKYICYIFLTDLYKIKLKSPCRCCYCKLLLLVSVEWSSYSEFRISYWSRDRSSSSFVVVVPPV